MRNRVARRLSARPARVCEASQWVGGPHEGCAEFAPDVLVRCTEIATREVRVLNVEQAMTRSGVKRSLTKMRMCTECAANWSTEAAGAFGTEAVLVRPLAGAR